MFSLWKFEQISKVIASTNIHIIIIIIVIIIIIHSFYIALFSAHEQTHCAHWHVTLNEWLYPFMARVINIHGSGVPIALFGCCMADAT